MKLSPSERHFARTCVLVALLTKVIPSVALNGATLSEPLPALYDEHLMKGVGGTVPPVLLQTNEQMEKVDGKLKQWKSLLDLIKSAKRKQDPMAASGDLGLPTDPSSMSSNDFGTFLQHVMSQALRPQINGMLRDLQNSLNTTYLAGYGQCDSSLHAYFGINGAFSPLSQNFTSNLASTLSCRSYQSYLVIALNQSQHLLAQLTALRNSTCGSFNALTVFGPSITLGNCTKPSGEMYQNYSARLLNLFQAEYFRWQVLQQACLNLTVSVVNQTNVVLALQQTLTKQIPICDAQQDAMDQSSCPMIDSMRAACQTYSQCYSQFTTTYNGLVPGFVQQRAQLVPQFASSYQMECLSAPALGQVATMDCNNLTYFLHQAERDCVLTYPSPVPKVPLNCPTLNVYASTAQYMQSIYGMFPANAPARNCSAICCTTTTTTTTVTVTTTTITVTSTSTTVTTSTATTTTTTTLPVGYWLVNANQTCQPATSEMAWNTTNLCFSQCSTAGYHYFAFSPSKTCRCCFDGYTTHASSGSNVYQSASVAIYNATSAFSSTLNPNGVWSAGWTAALGSAFNPFTKFALHPGMTVPIWNDPNILPQEYPSFWLNTGTSPVYGVLPGQLALQPGCNNGQFVALRFTASVAGSCRVLGSFLSAGSGVTTGNILLNGQSVAAYTSTANSPRFDLTLQAVTGGTIDFVVGVAGDNCVLDITVINAVITFLPSNLTVWNPAAEYGTTTANPNGLWSYGWTSRFGSNFNPFPRFSLQGSFTSPTWNDPSLIPAGTPCFWRNNGATVQTGIQPLQLALHPGCNNSQFAVLRFTTPFDGTYLINGTFTAGDVGTTTAAVLSNGATLTSFSSTSSSPTFAAYTTVSAGSVIDLAVGSGTDTCASDSTGVVATIRLVTTTTTSSVYVYNPATNYSFTSNPNGVWSSGWMSSPGSTFNVFPLRSGESGSLVAGWIDPSVIPRSPVFWLNTEQYPVYGILPGHIGLQPGCNKNQYAVLRFTAPILASCRITGSFTAADPGNTTGIIQLNGVTIVSFGSTTNSPTFDMTVAVMNGSTIDFMIGVSNDLCLQDGTGLNVNIVLSSATIVNFNATSGFSPTLNPCGVWSSGWTSGIGSTLNVFPWFSSQTGTSIYSWSDPTLLPLWTPSFWRNNATNTTRGIAPGQLALLPGCRSDNRFAVLRFTAPFAAAYRLTGSFPKGDSGDTSATIVASGVVLKSWPSTASSPSFNLAATVNLGDPIDFVVGSANHGCVADNTGIVLSITMIVAINTTSTTTMTAKVVLYDPAASFSTTSSSSGVWSAGFLSSSGQWVPLTDFSPVPGQAVWSSLSMLSLNSSLDASSKTDPIGAWTNPSYQNSSSWWLNTGLSEFLGIKPGQLALQPGCPNQPAYLRFKSVLNGSCRISGSFSDGDVGDTTASILLNGNSVLSFGSTMNSPTFDVTVQVANGSTINFVVGTSNDGCLGDSTGLTVSLAMVPSAVVNFSPNPAFSTTSNPSGLWSSGWTSSLGSELKPFRAFSKQVGTSLSSWLDPADSNSGAPAYWINTGSTILNGILPGQISLQPGCGTGKYAVLRFTAPFSGTYLVTGSFTNGDSGTISGTILANGQTLVSYPGITAASAFNISTTVTMGNPIDFAAAVLYNCASGSTGLTLSISYLGAATTTTTTILSGPTTTTTTLLAFTLVGANQDCQPATVWIPGQTPAGCASHCNSNGYSFFELDRSRNCKCCNAGYISIFNPGYGIYSIQNVYVTSNHVTTTTVR